MVVFTKLYCFTHLEAADMTVHHVVPPRRSLAMNPSSGDGRARSPSVQSRTTANTSPHACQRRRRHRLFGVLTAVLLVAGQETLFRRLLPLPEVLGFNRIHYQMLDYSNPNLRTSLKRGLVYDRLLVESQPDAFRRFTT